VQYATSQCCAGLSWSAAHSHLSQLQDQTVLRTGGQRRNWNESLSRACLRCDDLSNFWSRVRQQCWILAVRLPRLNSIQLINFISAIYLMLSQQFKQQLRIHIWNRSLNRTRTTLTTAIQKRIPALMLKTAPRQFPVTDLSNDWPWLQRSGLTAVTFSNYCTHPMRRPYWPYWHARWARQTRLARLVISCTWLIPK